MASNADQNRSVYSRSRRGEAIVPRGEEALLHIDENKPDIVLLDVHLKGALDGIATAHAIQKIANIPIIYVTANTDEATFNRAKETKPFAFISKPIKNMDLQRAIELTIGRMAELHSSSAERKLKDEAPFILSDRIFVRHNEKMVKIFIENILYIEAERNYCRIYTKNKEYMLATTLKVLEEKLPVQHFIRVHRSYMVNLTQIDEVAENHIIIFQKAIPMSTTSREELLKRIQTI